MQLKQIRIGGANIHTEHIRSQFKAGILTSETAESICDIATTKKLRQTANTVVFPALDIIAHAIEQQHL